MPGITTPSEARRVLAEATDIGGGTTPDRGEELYRFVRERRCTRCLELGFYQGVGTTYIAAALEANGAGEVTSVDIPAALEHSPGAEELVTRAGLGHRVDFVIDPDSYVWFLRRRLREQLRDTRIEPLYDFVFLDGAHTWQVDALAFACLDKLLVPGGWILFDDLDWAPFEPGYDVPEDTRNLAHVREIWDLLVTTNPTYDELRTDGSWGWARKSESGQPEIRTVVTHDLIEQLRRVSRIARSKLGR
jgi:predicted O-methyltransferase YrrM